MVDPPEPMAYWQLFMFFLGCCLGSFFNVVIYRLPQGKSIVSPGSHCPRCEKPIPAYDNIPVISFLLLRGRCRFCRAHISWRYPLVELLTGVLVWVLFRQHGWHPQFWVELVFVSALLIVSFIDLDTGIIPNAIALPGIILGFATSFLTPRLSWLESLQGLFFGAGLFYLVVVGYEWIRNQEGMGFGDINLLSMIGAFLGWRGVIFTVLVSSVVGSLVGFVVMYRGRKGLATVIRFGPFLALGAICYLFWGEAFLDWYWGLLS